jgi:coenzyme PQQ precursor peptide PqqA
MASPSHMAAWLSQPLEARPLRPAQPPMRGLFFHPASGHAFCVEAGNKGTRCRVNSSHAPSMGPQTRRRNNAMAWSTPEIREVCVGMEVTSYLSAEM